MQKGHRIVEITEGTTRILVPEKSVTEKSPPTEPAFFNPRARMNRDLSMLAYSAFVKGFHGPKIFVDCMSGLGSRGLRVANELQVERVVINDLNPSALQLARRSAALNSLENIEVTEKEACRLCGDFSKRNERASMVDIDPFGSPARFVDCGIRATMHGGILAVTATDLQVLNGMFQNACMRRYGGTPVRTKYGNEIAIRLVLGCIRHVAARMDIKVVPLFVESYMHYYRVFVRVLNRPDREENIGYIAHCGGCKDRRATSRHQASCELCGSGVMLSGPLWVGGLYEKGFLEGMAGELGHFHTHKKCEWIISAAIREAGMPAAYYTLDEIASEMGTSPMGLGEAVRRLTDGGFAASPTAFDPTGFKTDAPIDEIKRMFAG